MKKHKFRKEIVEFIASKFEESDQALGELVMDFKQLHRDVLTHETRISRLEKTINEMQADNVLTQACLAKTIIKNDNAKRELKYAIARSEHFYSRAVQFAEQLKQMRKELTTLKANANKTTPDTASEKTTDTGDHQVNEAAA